MDNNRLIEKSEERDRLAFTVLAIEASAQKMHISPTEMRRRLDKVGLIKSLIQDCYDTLHTESREAVANDVVEALQKLGKGRMMEKQTLYHGSTVVVEHTLRQLVYHKPNYQICILSQEIVDKYLQFQSFERIQPC